MIERSVKGARPPLLPDGPVPAEAYKQLTPSALSGFDLWRDRSPNWDHPGLYVGDAGDFTDIVNFWNLRAASLKVLFFDPQHEARLGEMGYPYGKTFRENPQSETKFGPEFRMRFTDSRKRDTNAL